jgi:hypothetical protein
MDSRPPNTVVYKRQKYILLYCQLYCTIKDGEKQYVIVNQDFILIAADNSFKQINNCNWNRNAPPDHWNETQSKK